VDRNNNCLVCSVLFMIEYFFISFRGLRIGGVYPADRRKRGCRVPTVDVTGKVDLNLKVGCISAKSLQVVLATSRRLQVALVSTWARLGHQSLPGLKTCVRNSNFLTVGAVKSPILHYRTNLVKIGHTVAEIS